MGADSAQSIESHEGRGLSDLSDTVEKLRAKLLDLSLRNPLLNFRFSRRSLRIIDELPSQVFTALIDGKSFSFAPLPDPTKTELSDWFQPQTDTSAGHAPLLEDIEVEKPAEESASDQKRTKKDISKSDWARFKTIDPSFDLPADPGASARRDHHRDTKLQTLEWHESLEALVRKLAQDARSAVNETGSNMLFLSVGFLEWRETEDSKARLAPLLLLPVELIRPEVRRGPRAYRLQSNGDDVQINLALKQKLEQDFGLTLPEFSDGVTVEDYFERVKKAMGGRPGWQVRRQMCLGLISQLGRLLLYHDLDPANWPGGGVFEKSDLVATLLGGIGESGASGGGIRYEVSDETIEQELDLPLVDRADSSQLEAVRMVLEGKNLVIQGPPGTGKSQTITNLIAALMSQGKTVLFVAEKLAALQVVERRLQALGLEAYCLELHSNKTQKKALLDAVRNRVESPAPRPKRELDKLHKRATLVRDSLNAYVDAVAAPQADEASTADLLLSAGYHALSVGEVARTIDKLRLPDLVARGLQELGDERLDIEGREQRLDELADAAAALSGQRPVSKSPWYGVTRLDLLPDDLPAVEEELAALLAALEVFQDQIGSLENDEGFRIDPAGPGHVSDVCADVKRLDRAWPRVEKLASALSGLLERMDLPLPHSWGTIVSLLRLRSLAVQAPLEDIHHNGEGLDAPDATRCLQQLKDEASAISSLVAENEIHLPRAFATGVETAELVVHATALKSVSPLLRLFSKPWAAAKNAIISMGGDFGSAKADVWSERLFALSDTIKRREALAADLDGHRIFSSSFRGMETDFDGLTRVMEWKARARDELADRRASEVLIGWLLDRSAAQLEQMASADLSAWQKALDWGLHEAGDPLLEAGNADLWTGFVETLATDDIAPLFLGDRGADPKPLFERFSSLATAAERLNEARHRMQIRLQPSEQQDELGIGDEISLVRSRLGELNTLPDWVQYARNRNAASDIATAPLIRAAEEGYPLFQDLPAVWRYCAYRSAAQSAFRSSPALFEKNGSERNRERHVFRQLDEALMEARRTAIATKLHKQNAPVGSGGPKVGDMTEMSLLRHQWGLQRPRISIRDLMRRAGRAVQAAPCRPCNLAS